MNALGYDIITFDLDGVLIDSDGLHDEAFIGALESLGLSASVDRYKELCKAEPLEAISTRGKLERLKLSDYYVSVKEKKDALFFDLLPRIKLNPWLRHDLERNFGRRPDELIGPKLAVVTNCTETMAHRLLSLAGIDDYMPVFSATGDIATKPHPALYTQAGIMLGYRDGQSWLALEDSDQGIAAASAAGVSRPLKTNFTDVQERLRTCAL